MQRYLPDIWVQFTSTIYANQSKYCKDWILSRCNIAKTNVYIYIFPGYVLCISNKACFCHNRLLICFFLTCHKFNLLSNTLLIFCLIICLIHNILNLKTFLLTIVFSWINKFSLFIKFAVLSKKFWKHLSTPATISSQSL